MKTENPVHFILRLALTLFLIAAITAAALAGVNALTEGRIAAMKEENTRQAIEAVLPGGGEEIPFTDESGIVSNVYASDSGYAVEVTPSGFGGSVDMMVGIDREGKVMGVQIISHSETPSLGASAASENEAGKSFRDQFIGLTGTLAVTKDGGEIDALTGATVTSRAVTAGVNAALSCVAGLS